MPEMFPEGTAEIHEDWLKAVMKSAHQLICISSAVKDETIEYTGLQDGLVNKNLNLSVLHHGADINASLPSQAEAPENWDVLLASINARPTFLMVSTIEPRKGYLQALEAFEKLWGEGVDINLVIIGKEGWKDLPAEKRRTIPKIIQLIKNHQELGQRLFWQENLADAHLQILYQKSTCLLAASENEGYGLPLIEAAQYELPILARDIPVFREVLDHFATYFDNASIDGLAASIIIWLEDFKRGTHIKSSGIPKQTWAKNVENLKNLLIKPAISSIPTPLKKNHHPRKRK
jgi:glycosyltransferase involved in cell wall biosynthesis